VAFFDLCDCLVLERFVWFSLFKFLFITHLMGNAGGRTDFEDFAVVIRLLIGSIAVAVKVIEVSEVALCITIGCVKSCRSFKPYVLRFILRLPYIYMKSTKQGFKIGLSYNSEY